MLSFCLQSLQSIINSVSIWLFLLIFLLLCSLEGCRGTPNLGLMGAKGGSGLKGLGCD